MDVIYDIVEGVHVFIPAVAVVFIAVTLFLCGPGKKETQSTAETHTISGASLQENDRKDKED
uniref:CcoQ/FixQ family Cbb3-type cytochrome c oxidase assembly chaperone n=1 Tax=Ascaris lumbricoides TaxID=6252 RepID=A0A0M3HPD0_ASCLU